MHYYLSQFFEALGYAAIFILVFMTIFFVYSLFRKRNDTADIIWGLGFIGVAWTMHAYVGSGIQSDIVFAAIALWGLRLSTHIYLRNAKKDEDFRYQAWRKSWMKRSYTYFVIRSYLQVFLFQGLLMLWISLPAIALAAASHPAWIGHNALLVRGSEIGHQLGQVTAQPDTVSPFLILGAILWLVGFFFEAVGDHQLSVFIKNPKNKGKIMTKGLWSLTRHPNYFGEVTQWWGIYLMILPLAWPLCLIALVGPLTISWLILKVSGIPMLEKKYEGNADFEKYKKRTSAFFPRLSI